MRAHAVIDVDLVGQECLSLRASGSFSEGRIAWCASRLARLATLDFACIELDLAPVTDIDAQGRALLREFAAAVQACGRRIVVTDPAGRLAPPVTLEASSSAGELVA